VPDERQAGIETDLLDSLRKKQPLLWLNSGLEAGADPIPGLDPASAEQRLARYAAPLSHLFPEMEPTGGRLYSALQPIPKTQAALQAAAGMPAAGSAGAGTGAATGAAGDGVWLLKRDDALPVAGSVKARGGFHEVLALAERLTAEAGRPISAGDPMQLCGDTVRALLGRHTLSVGSTGNLGMSIGLIGRRLGFQVVIHMSADAKQWKKERLRRHGITVVEHSGDYAAAVDAGRQEAARAANIHFVDDERSRYLFLGYAAAAGELTRQLQEQGRRVDADHPLFVYLPCGVGGAPGGIAYGLKLRFGGHVHCFFAEPTAAPCMLVQLAAGVDKAVSVYNIGLDNVTEADGLAVGLASPLVAPIMAKMLSGVFTVADDTLFRDAYLLAQQEGILLEPSAAAALRGPLWLRSTRRGGDYLDSHGLARTMDRATHVIWSTGGSLVPSEEHARFQARGAQAAA